MWENAARPNTVTPRSNTVRPVLNPQSTAQL
jgi:hypothetical protein